MSKTLGVVVARKHSRRVPRKNVRLLGFSIGKPKPLICWTFRVAKQAKSLDRIVVSTDDEEVRDLALKYGVEVPFFPRPAELSRDVDTALPLKHCLEFLEKKENYKPNLVCLLQPTSPFRLPEDIDECVRIAEETGCDTVLSVVPVSQHPFWTFKGEKNGEKIVLKPYEDVDLAGDVLVSQNLPKLWYPAGSVYVTKTELIKKGRIFGNNIIGYEVPRERAIDIEEEVDLLIAEAILKWRLEEFGLSRS